MGNQHSAAAAGRSGGGPGSGDHPDGVLESMQKEADRDAHLANLDHNSQFKRSKSLRKSISKRILRRQSKSSKSNLDSSQPDPDRTPDTSIRDVPDAVTASPSVATSPQPAAAAAAHSGSPSN